jgi:hypothetical protein
MRRRTKRSFLVAPQTRQLRCDQAAGEQRLMSRDDQTRCRRDPQHRQHLMNLLANREQGHTGW